VRYPRRVLHPRHAALRALALPAIAIALGCSGPSTGSVGAILGVDSETGAVHVRETRDGRAADKVGLLPGDELLMIDGVYVRDLGADAVRAKLRGPVGSSVELTVVRGEEVLRVKLVREPLGPAAAPPPPREQRIEP
jgi:C-terminal processing protease CtpA/Prc